MVGSSADPSTAKERCRSRALARWLTRPTETCTPVRVDWRRVAARFGLRSTQLPPVDPGGNVAVIAVSVRRNAVP